MAIRSLSIWRVPNLLLETRGYFLGEPDKVIDALGKWRSLLGVVTIAGAAIVYPAFAKNQPSQVEGIDTHSNVYYVANFIANWGGGVIVAVIATAFLLVAFSLVLTLAARSHRRRSTLWQLRWPFIAIGSFFGLLAGLAGLVALAQYAETWTAKRGGGVHALVIIASIPLVIVVVVWLFKALYLASIDVFRSGDGHPLLGPLVTTALVWILAGIAAAAGGTQGVPADVGLALTFGGPITVTVLNGYACARIKRKYHTLLFRDGPPRPAQHVGQ
jgi:hypothetical protein